MASSLTDVCRLCLETDYNLLWVFDQKLADKNKNLKEVISATTGVEIYPKDIISQKICTKCCQISMKMFQFREQSLKNDKFLKNQYAELLKSSKMKLKIPNTNITITAEKAEPKQEVSKPKYRIHPSVTNLFKENPQIRLPSVCLNSNIAPCVSLEMNAVETYFRNRNLDFQKCAQLALKTTRKIAVKKGSAKPVSKPLISDIPKVPTEKDKATDTLPKVSTEKNKAATLPKVPAEKSKGTETLVKKYSERNKAAAQQKVSTEENKTMDTSLKKNREKYKAAAPPPKEFTENKVADPLKIVPSIVVKATRASSNADAKKFPEKTCFKIVNVSHIVEENNSRSSEHSDSTFDEKSGPSNKRKLSPDDSSPERNPKKPTFIESLGLTPKKSLNNDSAGKLYLDKSVPLFMCNICNSVQYNNRDLKKHMLKHLRCQFCKLKFKNMDTKLFHIDKNCRIKNMMNNLPVVELDKVEFKLEVRSKYPDTFADFPSIPGLKPGEKNESRNEEISKPVESTEISEGYEEKPKSVKTIQSPEGCAGNTSSSVPNVSDVIEILSDEEEITSPQTSETPTSVRKKTMDTSLGADPKGTSTTPPISETSIPAMTDQTIGKKAPVEPPATTLISEIPPKAVSTIPNSFEPVTPSYIVKPDIKIKNVPFLDAFDPKANDMKIVTSLLTQLGLQSSLQFEKTTQTNLPWNNSIKVNRDFTTEMRNLRHMLLIYKIPVHISKGDFKVQYNYKTTAPREKKLFFWNSLVPIDLRSEGSRTNVNCPKTSDCVIPNNGNTQVTSNSSFTNNSIVIIQNPSNSLNTEMVTPFIPSSTNISNVPILTTVNTGNSVSVSSGLSYVLPQSCLSYNQSTPIIANPTVFNTVNNVNTAISTSGTSCIQPPSTISSYQTGPSISGVPVFNNVSSQSTATAGSQETSFMPPTSNTSFVQNTTTISGATVYASFNNSNTVISTSESSEMTCSQPPSSVSLNPATSVPQIIAPAGVNTLCVLTKASTNSLPDINKNSDSSTTKTTPLVAGDSVPVSASVTPISAPLTPVSTMQNSSTETSQNVIPCYSASAANGVPAAGRAAIRVRNLCELT